VGVGRWSTLLRQKWLRQRVGFVSFSGIREKEKLLHSNEMKEEKNL